ncbi:hypothetical protein I4U23_009312 [Adineta vaga]|nr:hypothetical protein I4U23_009312 [Adineta vaga]
MILPTIYDLSNDEHLIHVNFYRLELDENTTELTENLNITAIPAIQWYFHGNKLDELIGIDHEQFIQKTQYFAKIYKHKTIKEISNNIFIPSHDEKTKSTFYHFFLVRQTMYSNQKLVIDLLISVFATFILSTTILSISTPNWNIDTNHHRIGLFQQCLYKCCCTIKELHRTITLLALFSLVLLVTGTFASFLLMGSTIDKRNRCYILVPLTLFGAGIAMTLMFMKIHEQTYVNSYSAFIFLIDTVLAYVLGGITILHASMFYF